MRTQSVTCDACGATKRDTNKWFIATPYRGGLFLQHADGDIMTLEGVIDLCGSACVIAKVSEFLGEQK